MTRGRERLANPHQTPRRHPPREARGGFHRSATGSIAARRSRCPVTIDAAGRTMDRSQSPPAPVARPRRAFASRRTRLARPKCPAPAHAADAPQPTAVSPYLHGGVRLDRQSGAKKAPRPSMPSPRRWRRRFRAPRAWPDSALSQKLDRRDPSLRRGRPDPPTMDQKNMSSSSSSAPATKPPSPGPDGASAARSSARPNTTRCTARSASIV